MKLSTPMNSLVEKNLIIIEQFISLLQGTFIRDLSIIDFKLISLKQILKHRSQIVEQYKSCFIKT